MSVEAIVGEVREVQTQLREANIATNTVGYAASHILNVATELRGVLDQAQDLIQQLADDPAARVLMGMSVSEPLYEDGAQRLTDLEASSANPWLMDAATKARTAHAQVTSGEARKSQVLPELIAALVLGIKSAREVLPDIRDVSYDASMVATVAGRSASESKQYLEYYISDLQRPARQ